jgi:hypothetical protein
VGQTIGPNFKVQESKKKSGTNHRTNQPTEQLTEGRDLRKSTSRSLSVCLAIPVLTASLGSVTGTLKYNRNCAYANEFPVAVEDLDIDKLKTIPQGAIDLMRGQKLFGTQVLSYLSCQLHIRTTNSHAMCDFIKWRKVQDLVVQGAVGTVYLVAEQQK